MAPSYIMRMLAAHAVTALADDFLPNWMGRISSAIAGRSILDLTLPGTHDTMTYDLSRVVSDGGIDDMDTLAAILNEFGSLGGIGDFIKGQAHTQGLTIVEQLDAGIRFLDVRIMFTDDDWYSLHFMRSNRKVIEYLQQVRTWMDAHPTEIVVMWLTKHGSGCKTGGDQYPGVSKDKKQSLWQQIQDTFQGMLFDSAQSSLKSTPMTDLLARNHRLLVFASDFEEFTGSSETTLATDGCAVDNKLAMSNVYHEDLQQDLEFFSGIADIRAADKEAEHFFLLSMANSQPDSTITANAEITFLGGGSSNIPACAEAYNIPGMTQWCPETLLDVGQLTAYYKQLTIEGAYNANYTFPNAIYIDAVGPEGTIRTGTKLLSAGEDDIVCNIFKWSSCQTSQPRCDDGWTSNGESVHWNCYDGQGNKHGFCGLAWQDHYKCCRNADADHANDGYAYADTLIAYNVRRACDAGAAAKPEDCSSLIEMIEERRARHPVAQWSDVLTGRRDDWPTTPSAVV